MCRTMASIWDITPDRRRVEVQTADGKVYVGTVWDVVDKDEFEEEDGVQDDYIIMRCDGDKMLFLCRLQNRLAKDPLNK